ncbi:hypothetical protein GCM10009557_51410 [Virgisporangium ochraceum]|uniref:Uncharacterized protein n=1 Tax=Virgisporangium ochraceum TaxID=65505 RepID=A0A8J3ZKI2_9ACTN|nr:hypothetical protein [Virgisporangium ochraceum]GIJ66004.1 hypothetical protein Voc01_009210 [Virgisporangium ochraceum]
MTPLVVPLGQFLGTQYLADVHARNVRVGTQVVPLDDPHFGAWALMHGLPNRVGEQPWTRAAVAEAAGTTVDHLIDGLVGDGLATEVDPADGVAFARAHRMGHRMLGLGNTAERPGLFAIGLFDRPMVYVTRDVYDLWDACQLADSLWETCRAVAPDRPEELADGFLGTLHHLLAMSLVYVEPTT